MGTYSLNVILQNASRFSGPGLLLSINLLYNYFFTRCFITQVLSNSVAEALALDGDPSTTETQRFVRMFNRFFDLLNVRSLSESIRHRKPDVRPYRDLSDERLKVHNYVNTCISQLASQHFLTVVYSYPSPTFHPFLFLNPPTTHDCHASVSYNLNKNFLCSNYIYSGWKVTSCHT